MKRFQLLLLIGLLPAFCWGQVWNKTYANPATLSYFPPFPAYNYNVLYSSVYTCRSNLYTWDYRYGGLLSNGIAGYAAQGYSHYLMRLNPLGDTVWTRISPFGTGYILAAPTSICRLSNGDYSMTAM